MRNLIKYKYYILLGIIVIGIFIYYNSYNKKPKLFNIDLHISVIEDFINLNNDVVEVDDHSISGHTWVLNKKKEDNYYIKDSNWEKIIKNENEIKKFAMVHHDELSNYDGFIVTHTPSFLLLYESFNKPIIIINSCRYENPFTNNINKWNMLNNKIKNMWDNKQLYIVSNNKADQNYINIGCDIQSLYIPSICLYTNEKYTGNINKLLIYNNEKIFPENNKFQKKSELNKYTWEDIYSYKGIIHIPYEISTMSIFEQYSANVPLFFPSKKYLKQLLNDNIIGMQTLYSNQCPDKLVDILSPKNFFENWVEKADYYDTENMPYIQYFDSMDDLLNKINTVDYDDISYKMKEYNKEKYNIVTDSWNKLLINI